MVIPNALSSRRFSPTYTFGGANLNLPIIGTVASRTGLIFIRRSTQEIPVYRLALRSYIRQMVTNKRNMAWSIEGGRTRTGKLRPPVHGILKYLTDTVDGEDAPDVQVVPISVVYDQLHEVSLMTEEARGAQQDARGLALAGALRRGSSATGSAGPTSPSASRSRCASGWPTSRPRASPGTRPWSGSRSTSPTGSTARPRSRSPRSSRSPCSAPTAR